MLRSPKLYHLGFHSGPLFQLWLGRVTPALVSCMPQTKSIRQLLWINSLLWLSPLRVLFSEYLVCQRIHIIQYTLKEDWWWNVKLLLSCAKVHKMDTYALITFKDLKPVYLQVERAWSVTHREFRVSAKEEFWVTKMSAPWGQHLLHDITNGTYRILLGA